MKKETDMTPLKSDRGPLIKCGDCPWFKPTQVGPLGGYCEGYWFDSTIISAEQQICDGQRNPAFFHQDFWTKEDWDAHNTFERKWTERQAKEEERLKNRSIWKKIDDFLKLWL